MSTITGNPVLIQSRFGHQGNFELVVPAADRGLFFEWRNNDDPVFPWSGRLPFGENAAPVDAVTLIQSNFGDPGNLELIARAGDTLHFFWRDSGPAFAWNGPFPITSGAAGNPVLIQSRFGRQGNFELVYPAAGDGLSFMWRNNDDPNFPWSAPSTFGQNLGHVDAVTVIQSNFGDPGNLELIARVGDTLHFFWRDSGPAFAWNGPFRVLLAAVSLRAVQRPDGRFIEVTGTGFSPNANVHISYDIFTGGAPNTHETGDDALATTPDGAFHHDVKVSLADVGGVNVSVVDDTTRTRVDASI